MKKLFALLLALCLMCGVVSAVAEEDEWFFDDVPYEEPEPRRFELPYVSFETPGRCDMFDPYERSEGSHSIQGYVELVPCTDTAGTTWWLNQFFGISVSSYDFDILSHYGSLQGYANGGMTIGSSYKRTHRDIVTEDGITLVRRATGTDGYAFTYIWCLGNVGFEFSFDDFSNMTMNGKPVNVTMPGDDFYLNEVVLPIIRSVVLPDGSTAAAAAEAEAKAMEGRIRVGKFTFALPEGLTETERLTESFYEAATCDSENYSLMLISVDYSELGLPVNAIADDYQYTHMYWALQLFLGMEAEEAYDVLTEALSIDMQNGERLLAGATNSGIGVLTHYYRGETFVIVIIAPGDAADSAIGAALEMAMSFRLDGVSEEQMAADAEAARIAAEQAAMQKYVVITNSSANIRSGPDGSAAKITTAKQGDTFPLIGEDGNWYVIDVNGQTGYVTKSLSAIQ